MERMAKRGFGAKKIAEAQGVPRSTTKRQAVLNSDPEISHRTAQRHSAKTHHLTPDLTPSHSPQTPTAPRRQYGFRMILL